MAKDTEVEERAPRQRGRLGSRWALAGLAVLGLLSSGIAYGLLPAPSTGEGDISRVSVSSGGAQASGASESPAVSGNAGSVAFTSYAANLVSGDTNGAGDIFARDTASGETSRISVGSGGAQANAKSQLPSMSGDARFIAFESTASNLVSGDTNGVSDVFLRDRELGTTTRASVASSGVQGSGASVDATISADGRFLAFRSFANNLVSGDSNGYGDVFVRDLQAGTTSRVSVNSGGAEGLYDSWAPSISADGRFVAFTSLSVNLVADDKNRKADIFVRDRVASVTTRASVSSSGSEGNNGNQRASISGDGRFVAFHSDATNLVDGDTNGLTDVLLRDRTAGTTTRVSLANDGAQANGRSETAAISRDGRFVAFDTAASNLVGGDTNGSYDVLVFDRHLKRLRRGSVGGAGAQPNSTSTSPSISADGRHLAFRSFASNLVSGDTNAAPDIFLRDLGQPPVADIALSKADAADPVAVGADIQYTLTARNVGTAPVTGVTLEDPLPNGTEFVSASSSQGSCSFAAAKVTCNIGNVAPAAAPSATIVLRRSTVGTVTNTASVALNEVDSDTSNNSATETTTVSGTGKPNLALTKTDAKDPVTRGTDIRYTLTATNNGAADATGVTVSDPLPANTTFSSASSSQGTGCSTSAGEVTCQLGTIQPSASATVALVVSPTAEGTVTNIASVSANEADEDSSDNSASETTQVNPPAPSLTTSFGYLKPSFKVGERITYTLRVKENGPATSTGVRLSDPLPANTTFVSASTNKGSCAFDPATNAVNCDLGSLAPGVTATMSLALTSDREQVITNTATASSNQPDVDPADNAASQTTKATLVSEYPDRTWQTNGSVDSILYSGNTVYLAGKFTSVRPPGAALGAGEVSRNNAAAFNAVTGDLLPWNPNVNGAVRTMVTNGSTIYLGGDFTSVGGLFRNHIAAVSAADGAPTSWDPNVWSTVHSLALSPDNSRIYVGGSFKVVNGQTRLRLAALYTANRNLVPDFAPQIEYPAKPEVPYVTAVALSPDGATLYVGGVFDAVNGQAHKSAAKIDLATGAPVASWDAGIEKKENREESQVYEIVTKGSEVYVCGDFYKVQGSISPNLAVVNAAAGAHRRFPATDGAVNACVASAGRLYLGGHFENIRPNGDDFTNLLPRNHVASFDISSGTTSLWDPNANSIAGVYAFAVLPDRLAVGGYFSKIGRYTSQQGFAQFSGTP